MKILSTPIRVLFFAAAITLFALKLTAQVTFTKNTASLISQDSVETTGARFADYDNDGDLDMYLVNPFPAGSRNRLYQNNCDEFEFTRVIAIPEDIVSVPGFGEGLWVDVDNDGDSDLFVTIGGNNKLYENNGDGTFTRITTGVIVNDPHFSRQAGWADMNNDGFLDLFTGNNGGINENNSLYRSNGDGTFTAVVTGAIVNDGGNSNALAWSDYDNDGDMDLFVGNRNTFNFLYRNDGDTVFTKITGDDIVTKNPFENLVAHWIDYDNDGDLDIYSVRGFGAPVNSLFDNNSNGTFTLNTTAGSIVTDNETSVSQSWGDLDNDGDLDCIVGNIGANSYYNNNGNGTFTKITTGIIGNDVSNEANDTRMEDIDRDGFLEVYVSNSGGNPTNFLYTNNGNSNHWINIRLTGVTSNRSAVGARVFAKANIFGNDIRQMREVTNQSASNSPNNHIGLGDATSIDTLTIVWPASGTSQVFTNVAADRFIEITEGVNTLNSPIACTPNVLPANPGFISGKVFADLNGDCTFNPLAEFPLVNRMIRADPGPHFVYTDPNGNYEFSLAPGTYTINEVLPANNVWGLQSCQPNSTFTINVIAGNTVSGNNFSRIAAVLDFCEVNTDITTRTITGGTEPGGPCENSTGVLNNPCPGQTYEYCFIIENDPTSTTTIGIGTVADIILHPDLTINSVSSPAPNSCNLVTGSSTGSNTTSVTINEPIAPGGICQICLNVSIPSTSTATNYSAVVNWNIGGTGGANLIVDGDFEAGPPFPFAFTSDYTIDCVAAPRSACVGPNAKAVNGNHTGFDHTTGSGNFLFGDGSTVAGDNIWCQTVNGLTLGASYTFSAWFNNVDRIELNLSDPIFDITIGGLAICPPPLTLSEIPDVWVLKNCTFIASGTSLEFCIRTNNTNSGGNDFGIDDISLELTGCGGLVGDQLIENVSCACDPNDKRVQPEGCGPDGNIAITRDKEHLIYNIRFENVGSGAATDVLITDVLDEDFDISTLRILAASDSITDVQILPGNKLTISFDGINLPPIQSAPNNTGFVTFKITPKDGLAEGTQLTDQAGIVFDSNEEVRTSVALNTLRVAPKPRAEIVSSNASACDGGNAFNFSYTGGTEDNASFNWDFGANATPLTSTDKDPRGIIFSNTDSNLVTLAVTRFGCTDEITDTIIGLPDHREITAYVLLGLDEVIFGNNGEVRSGAIGEQNVDGAVNINNNATVAGTGSFVSADNLILSNNSQVSAAFTNNQGGSGTVLNTTDVYPSPLVILPDFPVFDQGLDDVEVGKKQTLTLPAGDYNVITVNQKGILVLSGDYNVGIIIVGPQGQIKYDGETALNIKGNVTVESSGSILPNNNGVDATDMVIYVEGDNVSFAPDVICEANLFAPNAHFLVGSNAILTGSFISKNIDIKPNAEVSLLSTCWESFENEVPLTAIVIERIENSFMNKQQLGSASPEISGGELELASTVTINPNPLSKNTTIGFMPNENGIVTIKVYNYSGKLVAILYDENADAGQQYHVVFDSGNLPSGIYMVVLWAKAATITRKLVVTR